MPKGKFGFDKGDPNINRAGRPIGSLNKKKVRWNNLQDLAEWAQETLENMKPETVLAYIEHKERLLFEKLSSVPATPSDSVENTKDAKSELDQAEANDSPQSGSDPIRLGTGETKI